MNGCAAAKCLLYCRCNDKMVLQLKTGRKDHFFQQNVVLLPTEFFIDGLGSLHIGSCTDVVINHASKIKLPWSGTKSEKAYKKFRYDQESDLHDEIFYFTNRLKCMTGLS